MHLEETAKTVASAGTGIVNCSAPFSGSAVNAEEAEFADKRVVHNFEHSAANGSISPTWRVRGSSVNGSSPSISGTSIGDGR